MLTPDLFAVRALEGLELIGEKKEILKEIRRETESGQKEEAVAKAVKKLWRTSACSVQLSECVRETVV